MCMFRFAEWVEKGESIELFGDGEQSRDFTYVDDIAKGTIAAQKEVGFEVPLVVRLEGTNVDAARHMLEEAKSEIPTMRTATDLADAARTVCNAVG